MIAYILFLVFLCMLLLLQISLKLGQIVKLLKKP